MEIYFDLAMRRQPPPRPRVHEGDSPRPRPVIASHRLGARGALSSWLTGRALVRKGAIARAARERAGA